VRAALSAPDFGGASVTIPHKLAIMPLLGALSDEAQAIGSVNTIVPRRRPDGTMELYGDNTDWAAIFHMVKINMNGIPPENARGLVIGAGGTSRAALYALHRVGLKTLYLFNRTRASAATLVEHFPADFDIHILDSLERFPNNAPPTVIVSTVPASATTISKDVKDAIHLPSTLFASSSGVVIDMAYKPSATPLLKLARSTNSSWTAVTGLSILLEQGYRQFEIWTERRAPRSIIEKEVVAKYTL